MTTPTLPPIPTNVSYRIVDMVREKISTQYVKASDTEVAKALGISRAAISAYKSGRDVMSSSTFAAATQFLQLEVGEMADLAVTLRAEASLNASEKQVWLMIRKWLCEKQKTKKVASILFGTVLVLGSAALPSQRVAASPAEGATPGMYIKSNRRRGIFRTVLRWLADPRLSPPLNGIVTAPAF